MTEEDRITAALEHATEAIKTLRRKLDTATEALQFYSGKYMPDTHVALEALEQIENEQ